MADAHKVVILGGGFGGLTAALKLKHAPVEVTLIDRCNYHLFQPLLYQVATGSLSPANVAGPLRQILHKQKNTKVLLGEAVGIDTANRQVILSDGKIPYDTLIVATGSSHQYFGHDEWEKFAPGLKNLNDATAMRGRILLAFEAAERETDPEKLKRLDDLRDRRRRAYRSRTGRRAGRNRARHAEARFPRHRSLENPNHSGRGNRPPAAIVPAEALRSCTQNAERPGCHGAHRRHGDRNRRRGRDHQRRRANRKNSDAHGVCGPREFWRRRWEKFWIRWSGRRWTRPAESWSSRI